MMSSNVAESVNFAFKDRRELCVTSMLSSIRVVLQKWFYERSKVSFAMKNHLYSWGKNVTILLELGGS